MYIPRRSCVELMTPEELAIREAVIAVEKLGAHPFLTDAVILLGRAQNKVADFVDLKDGDGGAKTSQSGPSR
jgi:hypothetical protein